MKVFIYTLIGAVIIIGGFIGFRYGLFEGSDNDSETPLISVNGEIEGEYSLWQIIALDEGYICNFEKEDKDSSVEGEILIAPGAKVRGDFDIETNIPGGTPPEQKFESHFLMRDGAIYTWTSILNIGFISPIAASTSPSSGTVVSVNEKIKYECSQTEPDQTKFEIPTDIDFRQSNF